MNITRLFPDLVTPAEFAAMKNVTRKTVSTNIKNGNIPVTVIGKNEKQFIDSVALADFSFNTSFNRNPNGSKG